MSNEKTDGSGYRPPWQGDAEYADALSRCTEWEWHYDSASNQVYFDGSFMDDMAFRQSQSYKRLRSSTGATFLTSPLDDAADRVRVVLLHCDTSALMAMAHEKAQMMDKAAHREGRVVAAALTILTERLWEYEENTGEIYCAGTLEESVGFIKTPAAKQLYESAGFTTQARMHTSQVGSCRVSFKTGDKNKIMAMAEEHVRIHGAASVEDIAFYVAREDKKRHERGTIHDPEALENVRQALTTLYPAPVAIWSCQQVTSDPFALSTIPRTLQSNLLPEEVVQVIYKKLTEFGIQASIHYEGNQGRLVLDYFDKKAYDALIKALPKEMQPRFQIVGPKQLDETLISRNGHSSEQKLN